MPKPLNWQALLVDGYEPMRKVQRVFSGCRTTEIDIGVVFADVRSSTAMGEQSSATEFAGRLNRFYATATDVLIHHDGLIDKLIGDEVMGLFVAGLAGPAYRRNAALAALDLARTSPRSATP